MNPEEEQINSENINENNSKSVGEKINSENIKKTHLITEENEIDQISRPIDDYYNFGWSNYSEITNGRFAMIGFITIIIIEILSKQSFLEWAGIL